MSLGKDLRWHLTRDQLSLLRPTTLEGYARFNSNMLHIDCESIFNNLENIILLNGKSSTYQPPDTWSG